VVWDDHEIANGHIGKLRCAEPLTKIEGDFFERSYRCCAGFIMSGYLSTASGRSSTADYRSFDFGELAKPAYLLEGGGRVTRSDWAEEINQLAYAD